jgi:signal transduction histidine kinase
MLFKRHATTSGSGVGLYLACNLAEKMKGKLRFSPAQGSGFIAYLTLQPGSTREGQAHG